MTGLSLWEGLLLPSGRRTGHTHDRRRIRRFGVAGSFTAISTNLMPCPPIDFVRLPGCRAVHLSWRLVPCAAPRVEETDEIVESGFIHQTEVSHARTGC